MILMMPTSQNNSYYMKHFFVRSIFSLLCFSLFLLPNIVTAQAQQPIEERLGLTYGQHSGLGTADVRLTAAKIINALLGLLGTACVVLIVYAGAKYMTSGGDESKMKEATKIIMGAIIGLLVIMSAYAISSYITTNIYQATFIGEAPTR